ASHSGEVTGSPAPARTGPATAPQANPDPPAGPAWGPHRPHYADHRAPRSPPDEAVPTPGPEPEIPGQLATLAPSNAQHAAAGGLVGTRPAGETRKNG